MSDSYAQVMRPSDEPGKRRATRSGTGRRPGATPSLAAAPAPAKPAPAPGHELPTDSATSAAEAMFAAAAAAFLAGRDAQAGPGFPSGDMPGPQRHAPSASPAAAGVHR